MLMKLTNFFVVLGLVCLVGTVLHPRTARAESDVLSRTRGYVLLQVEQHGEAWYVHPTDNARYYMKDGATAYQMMRAFGLGISNADLVRLQNGNTTLINQLRGRILLQVEAHGEAFYVHPRTGEAIYMQNGASAYEIMRFHSMGITDSDLVTIPSREFSPILSTTISGESHSGTVLGESEIVLSPNRQGTVPTDLDLIAASEEWLRLLNAFRREEGHAPVTLDQSLTDLAAKKAGALATSSEESFGTRSRFIGGSSQFDLIRIVSSQAEIRLNGTADTTQENLLLDLTAHFETIVTQGSSAAMWRPSSEALGMGFYFEETNEGEYLLYLVQAFGER